MKELEDRTAILQGGIIQNIYIIKYSNKYPVIKLCKGMTETGERPVGRFGQKCVGVFHYFLVGVLEKTSVRLLSEMKTVFW